MIRKHVTSIQIRRPQSHLDHPRQSSWSYFPEVDKNDDTNNDSLVKPRPQTVYSNVRVPVFKVIRVSQTVSGSNNTTSILKPETGNFEKHETESVSKPEIRSILELEAGTIPSLETKSISKPEIGSVSKPEARTIPSPETENVSRPERRTAVTKTETSTVTKAETGTVSYFQTGTCLKPQVESSKNDTETVLAKETVSEPVSVFKTSKPVPKRPPLAVQKRLRFTIPGEVDDLLRELSYGEDLNKIKEGGILYTRRYLLDTDTMKFLYLGSQKKFRKKNTSWSLSAIEEIREGEMENAKRLDRYDKYKVFMVVFGGAQNHEVLYLLCRDGKTRDKWVKGLRYALQLNQYLKQKENSNIWVRKAFDLADKNGDGKLDFEEVLKLLKTLNADMSKAYVKTMFDAADTNRVKGMKPTLDRDEFVAFFNMLNVRPEIEELFLKYSQDTGYLTASDLQMFLLHEQKEQETIENCKQLVTVYEPQPEQKRQEKMSLIGFTSFLMSQQQHLFKRRHRRVYQDMTQPMTNYFVNSSHNTYLAEDQLKGPSRVECYRTSLKKGCRCVELDCWNGSDGQPIIYHGYTLTSKILFSDVIQAIKEYAFVTSPYPVTLSIENHCDIEQQTVMAECMKSVFGDMLYMPAQEPKIPPSPHELKGKIIVKGKKLPPAPKGDDTNNNSNDGEVSEEEDVDEVMEKQTTTQTEAPKKSNKLKLSVFFSDTVGMKSIHFSSTSDLPSSPKFHVASIAEKKIQKLVDSELEGVCRYTRMNLIRTYPAGFRTDSSNYNPVPLWCGGCQIVALNFQTGGECMQLLHGRFMDNGNSGYVLKPECLMSDDGVKAVIGAKPSPTAKRVTINVISAFQLPKPGDSKKGEIIDPFLKIEVHGIEADKKQVKTTVITDNGFNPKWNEEFTFDISVPELALMRFVVYDYDATLDDFIGYYVVPVNSLAEGYRHFPLFNENGDMFEQGVVFVRVEVDDQH